MRSRCRLKNSTPSSISTASPLNPSASSWAAPRIMAAFLLLLGVCASPSTGQQTPNLPGLASSVPAPLLNGFIDPTSVAFSSPTSLSAFINDQIAQQQQFFQHTFYPPPPLIKPPQALQAPHGPYSRQTLQTGVPAPTPTGVSRLPVGAKAQDPTPPSPVYRPPNQHGLHPVEPLEAAQSGTIVFTQERTLSKVAPTLPPSISDEPVSGFRDIPADGSDIVPESLVDPQGGISQNNLKSGPPSCNSTCYKYKQQGKAVKTLENKFQRNKECHCDHDCAFFGDCCPDIISEQSTPEWFCLPTAGMHDFWVKQTCSKNWQGDPNIVRECEKQEEDAFIFDPFRFRPVSSLTSNISYKNLMCAICNDDIDNYSHWRIKLQPPPDAFYGINETDLKTLRFSADQNTWLINDRQVVLSLIPSEQVKPQHCNTIISRCLPKYRGTEIEDRCKGYQSAVTDASGSQHYRNIDCAHCNDVPMANIRCGLYTTSVYAINPRNLAFGLLLDFSGEGHVGRELACPGRQQEYDHFFGKCRDVFCPQANQVYRNRRCVAENSNEVEEDSSTSAPIDNGNMTERPVFSEDFLKCPRTFINSNDFTYLKNESIFVKKYNATYTKVNYLPTKSGAYICLLTVNMTFNELAKFSQSMGYISAVGLGVSIACLILHLSIFILLPEMRNLSGKNLACLSTSLLVAYVSFIAGQVDDSTAGTVACRGIALVTYSAFLAAFFWMNSMAFDVWRTLRMATRELRVTTGPQWKRFIFYSIYSWGMTAFIVGLSIVLENDSDLLPAEYRPAFGKYTCWFGHRKALLIFFVAPTGCLMLLNIIFFLLTALMIVSSSSASASIVKDPSSSVRTNYRLYSRLAIMLGLVWTTGFVAGYLNNEVLWYIFIVLNTLQGLFIFIAFSCTKKVMWYCKERLPDFLKPSVYRSSASSHSSGSGGGPHSSGSTQHSALSRRSSPRSSVNYRHTAPYLIYGGNNKLDMY